jgi:hypothetical protein
MNTKLTLNVEKKVIEKAKEFARKKGQSLSELVENYFKFLTKQHTKQDAELSPKVKALRGILKIGNASDYKQILEEEINRKHGS